MKTRLLIIITIGILPVIPASFGMCLVNEDWYEAPCLDTIANGWYNQDEVDQWANYYSYKGPIFMDTKYLELNEAIKEERVEEWASESIQNRNVYEYYFFSGRAPNTGEYRGQFNIISVNEKLLPHDPYSDDERLQIASEKKFYAEESMGFGSGVGLLDDSNFAQIITIIIIGVSAAIGLIVYWKKRK